MVLDFIDEKILKKDPEWMPYWGDPEPYDSSEFNDHILVFKAMEQLIEKTHQQIIKKSNKNDDDIDHQFNKRQRKSNANIDQKNKI